MIDDMKKYSLERKQSVLDWYRTHGLENGVSRSISILAQSQSCPCLIVAYWIGEEFGFNNDLLNCCNKLIEFYGYKKIDNAPEMAPLK